MLLNGHRPEATTLRELIGMRAGLGDKTFAVVGADAITYGEVDLRANRLANSLVRLGVGKGDVVATFMQNSVDHIVSWFACAKLGAVWSPFNAALMPQDLAYTIGDARPKVLLADAELAERYDAALALGVTPVEHVFVRGPDGRRVPFAELLDAPDHLPAADVEPGDPAGIIYTGGTTGRPKGVLIPNSWYFPGVLRYQEIFEPDPTDVHLSLGQLYHTIGNAVDVLSPLYAGITTVSMGWFSASRFLPTVRTHKVTLTVILGAHIARLMNTEAAQDDADNTLRRGVSVTGGLPRSLVEDFVERFDVPLLETYGQTETGPLGCINQRIEELPRQSLGSPHGWIEVKIADPQGHPLPDGETGEILLRPTVPGSFMLGYVNKPEQVVQATTDLWFHSGDLGFTDEYGDLHFSGRVAHLLRHKGENISAIEVEETLLAHDGVAGCGVVAVPSDMGDDDIKAFVVAAEGADPDPAGLIKFCASRLAGFKVPRYLEYVEDLPVSSTKGEVERFRLAQWGSGHTWDATTGEWAELG